MVEIVVEGRFEGIRGMKGLAMFVASCDGTNRQVLYDGTGWTAVGFDVAAFQEPICISSETMERGVFDAIVDRFVRQLNVDSFAKCSQHTIVI